MGADQDDAASGRGGLREDVGAMQAVLSASVAAGPGEFRGVAADVVEDAPGEGAGWRPWRKTRPSVSDRSQSGPIATSIRWMSRRCLVDPPSR